MSDWQIDDENYQQWIEKVESPALQKLTVPGAVVDNNNHWPRISLVMPTYNSTLHFLRDAIDSVLSQSYTKWQLCIADDASQRTEVLQLLDRYRGSDSRINIVKANSRGGIAAATNLALALADGAYIAFMDHDDTLNRHALLRVAECIRSNPTTQLLYSDSDSIDIDGVRSNPFFKPAWNYDLFLGQNYLNHLSVYNSQLIKQLGGLREGFEGSQDYDLALRAIERLRPTQIRHLPNILYHWRVHPDAVSQANLGGAVRSARRAVSEHLQRRKLSASVGAPHKALLYNRVNWVAPNPAPATHLLVYGTDRDMISASVRAINQMDKSEGRVSVSELLLPKNSSDPAVGQILATHCAAISEHTIGLFAAGLSPLSQDWLQRLNGILHRTDVGAVAPRLVDTQGTVVGGPLTLGIRNWYAGALPLAKTQHNVSPSNDGYFKRLRLDHQVSALHGACLFVKRESLAKVAGINSRLSALSLLGTDLCLRMSAAGLRSLWTPSVTMQCSSQGVSTLFLAEPNPAELRMVEKTWPQVNQCDPCYNPNLDRTGKRYQLPGNCTA